MELHYRTEFKVCARVTWKETVLRPDFSYDVDDRRPQTVDMLEKSCLSRGTNSPKGSNQGLNKCIEQRYPTANVISMNPTVGSRETSR
jgi:hypothetical protein